MDQWAVLVDNEVQFCSLVEGINGEEGSVEIVVFAPGNQQCGGKIFCFFGFMHKLDHVC